MLKAVIFELDGVVADSHPVHEAAWKQLFVEEGLSAESLRLDFLRAGHPRREILKHYLGTLNNQTIERLSRRKDELYLQEESHLKLQPNVARVLAQLSENRIPCALATSAGRPRTEQTILRFGIAARFAVILTGEDVSAAKPAPDIFLLAAQRLGVSSENAVVVEDSVAGVQAARAAGMKCVGFAPAGCFAELRDAGADDTIAELPVDALAYFRSLFEDPTQHASAAASGHSVPQMKGSI
jgi:HAD superfamily hydrolase (TIGR01509 family)